MDQPDPRPAPEGAAQFVQTDVLCVFCGYNLRGLRLDGRCPECAAPAAQELRYADRRWLKGVIGGLEGLSATWLAALVIGVAVPFVGFALLSVYDFWRDVWGSLCAPCLLLGYWIAMTGLNVWAMRTATLAEPCAPAAERRWSARRLALGASAFMFASSIAAPLAFVLAVYLGSVQELVAVGLLLMLSIAFPFCVWALFSYLRPLASRLPDLQLVRRTDVLRWLTLAFMAIWFGGFALAGIARILYGSSLLLFSFVVCWGLVMLALMLVLLIRSLFLVLEFARKIEDVLEEDADLGGDAAQTTC